MDKIAFYCCSDAVYIKKAVTALKSIERFYPEHDYIIVTDKTKLNTHDILPPIKTIHLDVSETYTKCKGKWKPICFWIYEVPKLLEDYKYSCAVDGDVFCINRGNLDWLHDVQHAAGIIKGPSPVINQHKEFLFEHFGIRPADVTRCTNTGVIWWNNSGFNNSPLLKTMRHVYKTLIDANIPIADQGLLDITLAILKQFDFTVIDPKWNYRFRHGPKKYKKLDNPPVNICHFVGRKPWGPHKDAEAFRVKCRLEWKNFYDNLWSDAVF